MMAGSLSFRRLDEKGVRVSSEIHSGYWVTAKESAAAKLEAPLLQPLISVSQAISSSVVPSAARRTALLVDVGRDTAELLSLWLAGMGLRVQQSEEPEQAPALVLAERAFPRREEQGWLEDLRDRFPATPVILLSPTLFSNVPARGAVARELGVAAVLATPLAREQLLNTVKELLMP